MKPVTRPNAPANPSQFEYSSDGDIAPIKQVADYTYQSIGLTKREMFAAMAMQGYIASYAGFATFSVGEIDAKRWIKIADLLIDALNQPTK